MGPGALGKCHSPISLPHPGHARLHACCTVAACNSMATLPRSQTDAAVGSRAACLNPQQLQLASSVAARAPPQQVVSEACTAVAAAVGQHISPAGVVPSASILQEAIVLQGGAHRDKLSSSSSSDNSGLSSHSMKGSSRSSTKASRILTADIKRCCSWREVRQLFATAGQRMNIIHVSACLSTLGKLLRDAPAEAWEAQELEQFLQQLERASAQLLSTVQVSCGQLLLLA